jgi:hypothetical protein
MEQQKSNTTYRAVVTKGKRQAHYTLVGAKDIEAAMKMAKKKYKKGLTQVAQITMTTKMIPVW